MKKNSTIFLVILMTGLAAAQQAAQKQISFVLSQDLIKRTAVDGKVVEEIVPTPKTVMPGDLLREEVSFKNVSDKPLSRLNVSVPVPSGTEFAGSATPQNERWSLFFSADGGKSFAVNPQQKVTVAENGKAVTKLVPAPTSAYTHVRWTVTNLKSDESLKLSFRVRVK